MASPARHQGGERYRLLETVRQYARDRLMEADGAEAVRSRHRDWFLALAEEAEPKLRGPQQLEWLRRLEGERDNLRAALERCLAEPGTRAEGVGGGGDAVAGVRLAAALWWFWRMRGHLAEGRRSLERALAGGRGAPPSCRVKALCEAGEVLRMQGEQESSASAHQEALALARNVEDKWGLAFSLFQLGLTLARQGDSKGDSKQVTALGQECLAVAQEVGDKWLLAQAYVLLGMSDLMQDDYERAAALQEEALALERQIGDRWILAMTLLHRALVAHVQRNYEQAEALHREGLVLFQELEDKRGIASCIEGFAWVAGGRNEAERAARLMGAAEAAREAVGSSLNRVSRALHDRSLNTVRAALGDEAFAAAWAKGRAMTLQQAVAYVIDEPSADTPTK